MTIRTRITANWNYILYNLQYEHDGSYNLQEQPEIARKLGTEVFDHITASINDTDWEGYSDQELIGVCSLLKDLGLAIHNK